MAIRFDGADLHFDTVDEVNEYFAKLCGENHYPDNTREQTTEPVRKYRTRNKKFKRWTNRDVEKLGELVEARKNGRGRVSKTSWTQIGRKMRRTPTSCIWKWRQLNGARRTVYV